MLKADLEAAGIAVTDAYGRKIDFHALRHTCGTRMARAGVPLAVAQKIMRHSDPKLTANFYTHVLVADKAKELAKLPSIQPAGPEAEATAKTGTDDAGATIEGKIVVMKIDSSGVDSEDKIRTYGDFKTDGNIPLSALPGNVKTPVALGETGVGNAGGQYWIRTSHPLLVRQVL